MAGLYKPYAGTITLAGASLANMSDRDRAKRLAFLPQQPLSDIDLTVRDVVLLGRFPHRSFGLFESLEDYRIAERAMRTTETLSFADRPMATLSGGEAQRVHIAAAFAQEPQIILLDEPTTSLDIQHQLAIFQILRDRAACEGVAVVVVTHDVNLAAQFCSHVLLLHEGQSVATGSPGAVLAPEVLGPVYGVDLATLTMPDDPRCRWVVPALTASK
jgi:iron complex transport system ATP-binding protein